MLGPIRLIPLKERGDDAGEQYGAKDHLSGLLLGTSGDGEQLGVLRSRVPETTKSAADNATIKPTRRSARFAILVNAYPAITLNSCNYS